MPGNDIRLPGIRDWKNGQARLDGGREKILVKFKTISEMKTRVISTFGYPALASEATQETGGSLFFAGGPQSKASKPSATHVSLPTTQASCPGPSSNASPGLTVISSPSELRVANCPERTYPTWAAESLPVCAPTCRDPSPSGKYSPRAVCRRVQDDSSSLASVEKRPCLICTVKTLC